MNQLNAPGFTLTATAFAAVLLCAVASQAQAQTAASDDPNAIKRVVVTAQKREQAPLDVPASVTAVDAERLAKGGLTKLEDYVAQVPGMSLTSNGSSMQVTLRGISTGLSQAAPTTAIYLDEAPVGSVNAYAVGSGLVPDIDPADLRRVEVLKGPQGTLFGAGAMGGMLHFVTAGPDYSRVSGSLTAGVDKVAHGATGNVGRLLVNVPFNDNTMALRFSASQRKDAGFIDEIGRGADANGTTVQNARLAFGWKVNPDWSLVASAMTQKFDADGVTLVSVDPATLKPVYGDLAHKSYVSDTTSGNKLDLYNLTVRGHVGDFSIVSSTTNQTRTAFAAGDGTLSYGTLLGLLTGDKDFALRINQNVRTKRFAQEVRAQSTAMDGKLDYEAGIYYTHEESVNRIPGFDTLSLSTGAVKPLYVPGTQILFPDGAAKLKIDTDYREVSVFANATYAFTPKFDMQAGVRYAQARQSYDQLYTGLFFTPNTSLQQDVDNNKATYLLTGRFKPTVNDSLYARIATGYRSGGPSAATPITGASPVVGPDSLTSLEAGWKTVSADGKYSFEAALFHTKWKDIQIQTSVAGSQFFVNGGSAVSRGAEATAAIYPVTGLNIRATAGFTDARLTEDTSKVLVDGKPMGVDGDRLPFVPRISMSLASDYRMPIGAGWFATVGGSASRTGERRSDYSGRGGVSVAGYNTVNVNAGVENASWRLTGYVKNLNDTRGIIYLIDTGLKPFTPTAPYDAGVIRPRTIGVEANYRF